MGVYQADPCETPSLSSGIAKLLLTRSAKHAWARHPRLNPEFKRVEEEKFDLGTTAHELLLRGLDIAHVVDADSWRSNAAKDERDNARAAGLVPLLVKDYERTQGMVEAIRAQLHGLNIPLFVDGKAEQTLVWEEQGVLCRARLDWLRDDHEAINDLKTTSASANPHDWCRRTLWGIGADIQVVMYRRGVLALTGRLPDFYYLVAECQAPYAISLVTLAPSALELAEKKLDRALHAWKECLATGIWPAYPTTVAYAELPPWVEQQYWDMEAAEEEVAAA
jgi:hypothetical protein